MSVNVGLVAVKGDNAVRTLIDVLGSVGGLVASTALSTGLNVAGVVVDGFEKLLGIGGDVGALAYDGTLSTVGGGTPVPLRPGYLAVLDHTPPSGMMLGVREGRLVAWPGHGGFMAVPGSYLLLRLESRVERDDWRQLDDIEEPLRDARQAADADTRRLHYQRAIVAAFTSPALHEADRIRIASALRELRDTDTGFGAAPNAPDRLQDVAELVTMSVEDALEHRPGLAALLA